MTILAAITAFFTIVGPALSPLLVKWAEDYVARSKRKPQEEIDALVKQHMAGNPTGNILLAERLSTLSRELNRKRRHSGH